MLFSIFNLSSVYFTHPNYCFITFYKAINYQSLTAHLYFFSSCCYLIYFILQVGVIHMRSVI
ncbi:hypothetical protein PALI_b0796 [Pseudoalteromonas aliena SW19]|uniref:Uncharacterized protein n=1 Tax=Pseudoalteromonas aliena SW19 TaxID=1314866 RepID=A0ABR9E582_9GAMM|nr:hypothetical protein [Pseudoalteromonas aliena SW19]